ncbi:Pre-rRNA-processing protein esf-2 [Zancudomyces culisetae]|uniref:Pre-rRNA-processing protein esf-2 n=1 Tax=Zancudomyces culisetae TaxID=1213189 RepID=A0A1R1PUJ0_ZANCU|nr:Pre-rRNA-processing protein esf-2 [Zancudomyces culisetae]|eukprot:OMH84641.1 Pre-rRNA-processing protein esf-2 [Zancudomyces culisetae]
METNVVDTSAIHLSKNLRKRKVSTSEKESPTKKPCQDNEPTTLNSEDDHEEYVEAERSTEDSEPESTDDMRQRKLNKAKSKKEVVPLTPEELLEYQKAEKKTGENVGEIWRDREDVLSTRSIFNAHSASKMILDPNVRKRRINGGGNKRKGFTEGWIEFKDKKVAKSVAEMLNNQPMEKEQRLRNEILQARKEANEYLQNIEKSKTINGIEAKNRAKRQKTAGLTELEEAEDLESGGKPKVERRFKQRQARARDVTSTGGRANGIDALMSNVLEKLL